MEQENEVMRTEAMQAKVKLQQLESLVRGQQEQQQQQVRSVVQPLPIHFPSSVSVSQCSHMIRKIENVIHTDTSRKVQWPRRQAHMHQFGKILR